MDEETDPLPPNVKHRIHEITSAILEIDARIKERLLRELKDRTLELAGIDPNLD
jgi:hypothetical protein